MPPPEIDVTDYKIFLAEILPSFPRLCILPHIHRLTRRCWRNVGSFTVLSSLYALSNSRHRYKIVSKRDTEPQLVPRGIALPRWHLQEGKSCGKSRLPAASASSASHTTHHCYTSSMPFHVKEGPLGPLHPPILGTYITYVT